MKNQIQTPKNAADAVTTGFVFAAKTVPLCRGRPQTGVVSIETKPNPADMASMFTHIDAMFKDINAMFNNINAMFTHINAMFKDIKSMFKHINAMFKASGPMFKYIELMSAGIEKMSKDINFWIISIY